VSREAPAIRLSSAAIAPEPAAIAVQLRVSQPPPWSPALFGKLAVGSRPLAAASKPAGLSVSRSTFPRSYFVSRSSNCLFTLPPRRAPFTGDGRRIDTALRPFP